MGWVNRWIELCWLADPFQDSDPNFVDQFSDPGSVIGPFCVCVSTINFERSCL